MKVIHPRTKFTCPILLNQIKVTWIVITYTLPVPGCPTGYTGPGIHGPPLKNFAGPRGSTFRSLDPCTGPGGIHNNSANYDCIGGAASYVDKLVLGETHIYKWPTAREIYFPDGGLFNSCVGIWTFLSKLF